MRTINVNINLLFYTISVQAWNRIDFFTESKIVNAV